MNNPINVLLLLLPILAAAFAIAVSYSPDVLDIFARKMRARARAIRVSKLYWEIAYDESMREDETRKRERQEMPELVHNEYAILAKERAEAQNGVIATR
jgi:hypothetical protein